MNLHNVGRYFPLQYQRLKNGKVKHRGKSYYKWFTTPHRLVYQYTVGEYQKIKLTRFDPGSRDKIRKWLKAMFDFSFSTYTEKSTPKVEGDELVELGDYGADLKRYLKLVKDISQLRGLIEAIRSDSTVTSRIDTNGTVTGRFTSSNVNLNQIPTAKEFRQLFTAPEGWTFVGTDFDGQENVNLAEALYPFDNGRLNEIITAGDKDLGTDLHSLNAKSCGVSRTDAKPLWFGFLYGSSATLTGYTLLGKKDYVSYTEQEWEDANTKIQKRLTEPDEEGIQYYPVKSGQSAVYVPYTDQLIKQAIFGAQVQSRLIQSTNGLSDLITKFNKDVRDTGGITTLGGRFIPVSSSHKCLNYFCQGQGAESMKYLIRTVHRKFRDKRWTHGIDFIQQATIYDELDFLVRDHLVEEFSTILKESYTDISRQLGMTCTYTGGVMTGKNWYECH